MVRIAIKKNLMKRRGRKAMRKSSVAKVSQPLRRAIKAVAKSQMETKYRAEYIDQNLGVTAGTAVPAGLRRMLPPQSIKALETATVSVTVLNQCGMDYGYSSFPGNSFRGCWCLFRR